MRLFLAAALLMAAPAAAQAQAASDAEVAQGAAACAAYVDKTPALLIWDRTLNRNRVAMWEWKLKLGADAKWEPCVAIEKENDKRQAAAEAADAALRATRDLADKLNIPVK